MMKDMSEMVQEQAEDLENLKNNVEISNTNNKKALDEIKITDKRQAESWYCKFM